MRLKHSVVWAVLFCLFPWPATALDLSDIRLNGFVSQGYLKSTDNNFLADSKDGTFQFNEVGLTVNTQVSDKLRLGAQLLSRDLGEVGNSDVRLDWGFGDYHFQDYLGVRLGKVKLPLGLYNAGRDVDFLRPMIFLPQSIYNENQRDMLVAYQGAGLYGNLATEPVGNLDYHLFYGTTNMPDDALMMKTLRGAFNMVSLGQGGARVTDVEEGDSIIYGGSLVYNTPLEGLRFGATYLNSKNDFMVGLADQSSAEGRAEINNNYVLSLEYIHPNFGLAAEYMEMDSSKKFLGITTPEKTPQAWYVMMNWFATDQLTFSVLYDILYADKDDKDGKAFQAQGLPDFLGWRKDLGMGVRYDVSNNWTLKAEYHLVDGMDSFSTVLNDVGGMKEDWDYYAIKATFNF